MHLPSLATAEGLASLDQHLLDRSFVSGYSPSRVDLTVLKQLGPHARLEQFINIGRWATNLRSYSPDEQSHFPAGEPVEIDQTVIGGGSGVPPPEVSVDDPSAVSVAQLVPLHVVLSLPAHSNLLQQGSE